MKTRYFEKNEPVLVPSDTNCPRGKGMKRSTLGSGGQSSRSHEDEDRSGGLAKSRTARSDDSSDVVRRPCSD